MATWLRGHGIGKHSIDTHLETSVTKRATNPRDPAGPHPSSPAVVRAAGARATRTRTASSTSATPLELSVATILSAQSTDVRVNMTTPAVFAKYRTAADYAAASRGELEDLVKSTGFFRNKTTSIISLGQALVERFDGEVPRTLAELVTLPGFGRKTANVVLGHAFGVPGITVDTHMARLTQRFGITTATDPVKIELELNAQLPKAQWTEFSDRVIFHGRRVCHAKKPACGACFLAPLCPSYGVGTTDPEAAAALVVGPEREHLLSMVGLGHAHAAGEQPVGERAGRRAAGRRAEPDGLRGRRRRAVRPVGGGWSVTTCCRPGCIRWWPACTTPSCPDSCTTWSVSPRRTPGAVRC